MTYTTADTLASLRRQVIVVGTSPDGTRWGLVYLKNARLPRQRDAKFCAHLLALEKAGSYKVFCDSDFSDFGYVLMT